MKVDPQRSFPRLLALVIGLFTLAVILVLFLKTRHPADVATSDGFVQPAGNANSDPQLQALPVLRTSISPFDDTIQKELDHVDPHLDGWESEAFSQQASDQLKQLGRALQALAASQVPDLGKLLHLEFSCSSLRPEQLTEVYRDRLVSVSRWDPSDRARSRVFEHESGFVEAGIRLVALWRNTSRRRDLRTTFKVVRVVLMDAEALTTVKVQVAGPMAGGYAQQNAVWTCRWVRSQSSAELTMKSIEVRDFEEVVSRKVEGPLLADCTEAVLGANPSFRQQLSLGIDHWRDTLDWRLGLDVAGPHGLAVGDVNGDGLDDVFLCEPGGLPNRLYVQNPNGTARDVSAAAGVDWLEPATSALLVDMDNDGDQDLLFTSGRYFVSCENNGDTTFQQRTVLTMAGVARSMAAADYDNDGSLDIYICCYIGRNVALDDVGLGMPMPYQDANNGPANYLFANLGDWRYQDVTSKVGLDTNNHRFSYAAAWEDYDSDGDADLYVANDFGRNNLYRNDGGTFVDVAAEAGVEDIATGMSVSWGDYNRDGHMDLYVGNMFSTAGNRIMYQRQFQSQTDEATRNVFRRLARGNSLFANNGDGSFRDVSIEAGVTFGRWAWASLFTDLNNDGWEDIIVANGMITSAEDTGDL